MAHDRDSGADDRPCAVHRGAAALELDRLAAGLLDQPLGALDRLLVATSYEPNGMSPTISGVFRPRRTALPSIAISSIETGSVPG